MMTDPDEITTDVDPRGSPRSGPERRSRRGGATGPDAAPADREPVTAEPVNAEPVDAGGDWRDVEPAWDPEATVGVSDGLHRTHPPGDRHERHSARADPPCAAASDARLLGHHADGPLPRPPSPTPTAPVTVQSTPPPSRRPEPVSASSELASTTVRWEPRQRLTVHRARHRDTAVIAPPTHARSRPDEGRASPSSSRSR